MGEFREHFSMGNGENKGEQVEKEDKKPEKPIWERQRELFSDLENKAEEIEHEDLLNLAYRLFEHSIDDGLKMAQRWGLTPDEIKECLERPQFFVKHIKFATYLKNELKKKQRKIKSENKEKINGLIGKYEEFIQKEENGEYLDLLKSSPEARANNPLAKDLMRQMDEIYAEYLREREVKEKYLFNPRSRGEILAENNLIKAQRALESKYYRGSILELVFRKAIIIDPDFVRQQAKKEFNRNKFLQEEYGDFEKYYRVLNKQQAPYTNTALAYLAKQGLSDGELDKLESDNLIGKELVDKIQDKLDLGPSQLKRARYKPLSISFKMENKLARKELAGEINQFLRNRLGEEVRVVYDEDKGEYIVEGIKEEQPESGGIKKEIEKEIKLKDDTKISSLTEINGKLAYKAKENGREFIVYDGKKLEEFDMVFIPTEINGKLAYVAEENNKWFVIYDGKKQEEFDWVGILTEINGKLVYRAKENGKQFVIYDGKKLEEFDEIWWLKEINGKLAYRAKENGKQFVIYDGKRQEEFDEIWWLKEINGKLAYEAKENGREFVIYDGKKLEEFDEVDGLTEINGKLAYKAKENSKQFVIYDGKKLEEFDEIWWLKEINGKLAYRAKENGKEFVVYDGKKLEDYGSIRETKDEYILWGQSQNRLKVREITKQDKEIDYQLTEEEKSMLELLNLVNSPQLNRINDYLEKKSRLKKEHNKNWQEKLKTGLQSSSSFAQHLSELIKESPRLFLDTIAAKKDRRQLINIQVEQTINRIFPELLEKGERKLFNFDNLGFSNYGGGLERKRRGGENPENYLKPEESHELVGGDLDSQGEKKQSPEVMEFRESIRDLIVSNILGRYNNETKRWGKIYFPVSRKIEDPIDEITATLPNVKHLSRLSLPKPLEAEIIKERVKGVKSDGTEINLKAETNSLGEVTVKKQAGVEKITYSFIKNRIPEVMRQLSAEEYEKYKKRFVKLFGEKKENKQSEKNSPLLENLAELPEEMNVFINSIKDQPPKEKVIAIEKFVRDMGYYDFGNGQVSNLKRGKTIEEQIYIMEQRAEWLKKNKPELADKLKRKKYAGVCSDFTLLTTALLRKAGFLSGILIGFLPAGKKVTTREAHSAAFVVWPDEQGGNKVFSVDGTPSGVPGISGSSIEEKEEQIKKEQETVKQEAEQKLEDINRKLAERNPEEIKKLTNGKLEKVVNLVLKYEVKMADLQVLKRVLEAYWYTPAKDMDLSKVREFLAEEYKKERELIEREQPEAINQPAGKYLFETIQNFIERLIKAKHIKDTEEGFNLVENIFETVKNELSPAEQRSIAAIITYLRAKKMSK